MTNSPTPLETAVEELTSIIITYMSGYTGRNLKDSNSQREIQHWIELAFAKQLSTLRQNSVAKSVWDETHAKYLEECEKNLALQTENEAFEHKIITLACKGTDATRFDSVAEMQVASLYKWWKESEQSCDSLKSALEAMTKERGDNDYMGTLLAIVHCDGGQHRVTHGIINSTDSAIEIVVNLKQQLESTRAENRKMREALILILPMAKGYACNHPVGDNWKMIEQAEAMAFSTLPTNADNSKEDVK